MVSYQVEISTPIFYPSLKAFHPLSTSLTTVHVGGHLIPSCCFFNYWFYKVLQPLKDQRTTDVDFHPASTSSTTVHVGGHLVPKWMFF